MSKGVDMRKSGIGVAVVAAAAATALLGSGVANAGPAPTVDYQLCGYTYNGTIVDNVDPPSGSTVAGSKTVTGVLKNALGGTVATYSTTSNATTGAYCITGDSSMVGVILGFGWVELSSPGGTTYHAKIKTADFLDHKVSGLDSATNFHVAY